MRLQQTLCFLVTIVPSISDARSTLYQAEKASTRSAASAPASAASPASKAGGDRNWSMIVNGNPIIAAPGIVYREPQGIRSGDVLFARVPHSVIAFSESKAPVSARISQVGGRDYVMVGEATLEKASKRILLTFKTLREASGDETFDVVAQGLSLDGTLGVEGEYISGESKLFAAELVAAGAAGFADASISRSTNVLGQVQDENSLDTKSKKALGTALSRTADRFAEKQKQSPEYAVLSGPVALKILFLEQPRRKL